MYGLGSAFRDWSSGLGLGFGFRVLGLSVKDEVLGYRVEFGLQVSGLGFRLL